METMLIKRLVVVSQLCLICVFSSCDNEEIQYSCDKTANEWVKENIKEVRSMEISDFLGLDKTYQKAVYIAFTPEQRKQIWIDKFNEALKLDWTVEEKEHLKELISACNTYSDIFEGDVEEDRKDKFKIWAYKWIKVATEQLGWKTELVKSLLVKPDQLLNKEGEIREFNVKSARIKTRTEVGDKCNCSSTSGNTGEGMVWDDCDIQCIQGYWDCKSTWLGCGMFMAEPCDGYCW